MKGNVLVGDLLAHDLVDRNMINVKAEISGHQQRRVLLLRLAAHRDERDLLSDIGQRVRNGFTGLNIDRSNNVGAGDIRLAILPDDVVLILEPVLEFLITAVHCDRAPVITEYIETHIPTKIISIVGQLTRSDSFIGEYTSSSELVVGV